MKDKKVEKYYDSVAEEYNEVFYIKENEYPPLRYRHNYMLKMIFDEDLDENINILDIGCGPGEMCLDLSKKFHKIYGIDISGEMIKIAKSKLKDPEMQKKIIFEVGDIEDLHYDAGFFDVVICSGVIEYLKDDKKWSEELSRVLGKNGLLVINVTNKYAVRRWTFPFFNFFKISDPVFRFLNFVKTRVLKKEPLNKFPFTPRVHSPKRFDQFLSDAGFKKISHNYFDFSIFPYPVDTLLNFVLLPIRKKMEKLSAKDPKYWGNGYIVKCKKIAPDK